VTKKRRGQFIVDLGDFEVSDEMRERIARSVQKAALVEIASIDEAPAFSVQMTRPQDGGDLPGLLATDGIWIDADPGPVDPQSPDE
jgi:hypothetical protein